MKKIVSFLILSLNFANSIYSQSSSALDLNIVDSLSSTYNNSVDQDEYTQFISKIDTLLSQFAYDSVNKLLLDSNCILDDQVKYNFLGVVSYKQGDRLKAKEYWLKSTVNNQYLHLTFKNLGMYYSYENDVDNAISNYEHALSIIGEKDVQILVNLAYLYRNKQDFKRSLSIWGAIKTLYPAIYNESEVAYIYKLVGEPEKSAHLFENIKKKNKLPEWAYITLIQIYEKDSLLKTIALCKEAIDEYKDNSDLYYEYMRILIGNGLSDELYSLIRKYKDNSKLFSGKIEGIILDYFIATKNYDVVASVYLDSNQSKLNGVALDDTQLISGIDLQTIDEESEENLIEFLYNHKDYKNIIKQDSIRTVVNPKLKFIVAKSYYAEGDGDKFSEILHLLYNEKVFDIDEEFILNYSLVLAFDGKWSDAQSAVNSISEVDGNTTIRVIKKIFQSQDSVLVAAISPFLIIKQAYSTGDREVDDFLMLLSGKIVSDSLFKSDKFTSFNLLELIGDNYFKQGEYEKALQYFKKSETEGLGLLCGNDSYFLKYKESLCYDRMGDDKSCKDILSYLEETSPNNQYLHNLMIGYFFAKYGDVDRALEIWENIDKTGIFDYNLSRNIALGYLAKKDYVQGINKLKALYDLNPDSLSLIYDIYKSYLDIGEEELSEIYRKKYENSQVVYYTLNELEIMYREIMQLENRTLDEEKIVFEYYVRKNEKSNAIRFFESSEHIKDGSLEIKLQYATTLIENYELKKAYKYLKKLESVNSDKLYYLEIVALCQAKNTTKFDEIVKKISSEEFKLASEIVYFAAINDCEELTKVIEKFKNSNSSINLFGVKQKCR